MKIEIEDPKVRNSAYLQGAIDLLRGRNYVYYADVLRDVANASEALMPITAGETVYNHYDEEVEVIFVKDEVAWVKYPKSISQGYLTDLKTLSRFPKD